jgi:acetyl esterase/lipase
MIKMVFVFVFVFTLLPMTMASAQSQIIEPQPSSYEAFPESTLSTEGMQVIQADFSEPVCTTHVGVEYAQKSGMALHLNIIEPRQKEGEDNTYPLIIYIQGSAWFPQNTAYELTQLGRFAQRGFVIAVVEYRPSPVAPFPAQVKDTKTALRFMKQHAADYHADPDKIIVWGDSSGGHTAAMVGVSLNEAALDDESPAADPIEVKAIVDYYGPTDISTMNEEPSTFDHIAPDSPEGMLIGGVNVLENPEKVKPTVPMNYLSEDVEIPPFLIVHGNKDRLVPFGQSVMLFDALKKTNKEAVFYQLKGADHGGAPFWAEPVLDIVEQFVRKYL